jgi:hypothetical protein
MVMLPPIALGSYGDVTKLLRFRALLMTDAGDSSAV